MGGAAGHMMHIFDNGELTFQQVVNMLKDVLMGVVPLCEKTDGFNIHATMKEGQIFFARNKTTIKDPISETELPGLFKESHVKQIFSEAARDLKLAFRDMKYEDLDGWFVNCEILDSRTNRVLDYEPAIQIHHMSKFDETGTLVETKPFRSVWSEQKYFTVKGPKEIHTFRHTNFKSEPLSNAIAELMSELMDLYKSECPVDPNVKLNDVYAQNLLWILKRNYDIDAGDAMPDIIDRWVMRNTSNMKAIKANLSEADGKNFTVADKKDRYKLTRLAKFKVEVLLSKFINKVLGLIYAHSDLLSETTYTKMNEVVTKAEQFLEDHPEEIAEEHTSLFKALDMYDLVPFEGVVFQYSDCTYKMVGNYSAINLVIDYMNRRSLKEAENGKQEVNEQGAPN